MEPLCLVVETGRGWSWFVGPSIIVTGLLAVLALRARRRARGVDRPGRRRSGRRAGLAGRCPPHRAGDHGRRLRGRAGGHRRRHVLRHRPAARGPRHGARPARAAQRPPQPDHPGRPRHAGHRARVRVSSTSPTCRWRPRRATSCAPWTRRPCPTRFSAFYGGQDTYPAGIVEHDDPYILRDHRGMVVDANVFQYDAGRRTPARLHAPGDRGRRPRARARSTCSSATARRRRSTRSSPASTAATSSTPPPARATRRSRKTAAC